ncbi:MAG: lipid A deacylase LpxR family protein [Desulfobacteraceae bacterium]
MNHLNEKRVLQAKRSSRFPGIRLGPKELSALFLIFFITIFPDISRGEKANPWTHSFYFENDLFTGTDSNYTNGIKYAVISPDLSPNAKTSGNVPEKVLNWIHKIPFIKETPPETSHKVEFAAGQNMFTPADTAAHDLDETDRPYAGWTYLATSYHHKSDITPRQSIMDTVELQLGMVGPASLAENSQKFIHRLRNLQTPNGWEHQLSNEPGVIIAWERKWLCHPVKQGLGWDTICHTGFTLGNVSTYINGGMELRFGWNIPKSFGVSLIRPAGSTRMNVAENPGFYLLAAGNARWVIRDIFLDGNTFTRSHSVDKKPLNADFSAGIAFSWHRLMVTLTQVLETEKFDGQSDPHTYGALSLSWFF